MNKIKIFLKNERGFLMLNVIFLTVITSFAAMILFNAAPRVKNPQSTLRLTALYLANEQFAHLESLAASGEELPTNFLGKPEDLISNNNGVTTTFNVETKPNNSNPCKVKVKVSWSDKDFIEVERTIWIVPKENS